MRIDRLRLENFCGFEDLELDLHPRCTVLAGVNGSGKSSVLKGLSVALGAWFLGFDSIAPRSIENDEVRLARHWVKEVANLEPQYPVRVSAHGDLDGASVSWSRERRGEGRKTTYAGASDLHAASARAQAAVKRGEPVDLPIIASYGTGRLWIQKRASNRKDEAIGSRTLAYEDCLDAASSHKLFEAWMRRQESARIQHYAEEATRNGNFTIFLSRFDDGALRAVERAAVTCIPGAERLYYKVAADELWVRLAGDREMPFRLLSDGYRDLVAIAADLAWRAVQLNPHLGAEAPQVARGVVLIDEVELHLHPAWQRTVLENLLSAFPNLQFVVTTHSPQVLGNCPAERIRLLDGQGRVHRVGVAQGLDTNTVLRDLMGVSERPEREFQRLAGIADAIEALRFEDAQREIDALAQMLGVDDPNLTALAWELAAARAAAEP